MVLSASKKNVMFSDLAATYGAGDLCHLIRKRYDLAFSLWLNSTRSRLRQAEIVRLGALTAVSGGQGKGWFFANTDTRDEAISQYERHRSQMNREAAKR